MIKYVLLILLIFSLISIIGCEGTGLDKLKPPSEGHSPGTETILAQGEFTVTEDADLAKIGEVEVTDKGLIVAVLIWSGDPSELTVSLTNQGSDTTADASGVSPLAVTANVSEDDIAAGAIWELSVSNPAGIETIVTYQVVLIKQ